MISALHKTINGDIMNTEKRSSFIKKALTVLLFSVLLLLCTAWVSFDILFVRTDSISSADKENAAISKETQKEETMHDDDTVALPDLRGKDPREAVNVLGSLGLISDIRESRTHAAIELGNESDTVLDSFPSAGTTVKHGDSIILYISRACQQSSVRCPDLSGMCRLDALCALHSAGLELGVVSYEGVFYPSDGIGTVTLQSRIPGTLLPLGSKIDITLSSPTQGSVEDEITNNSPTEDNSHKDRSYRWNTSTTEG